jgi:Neocarzinostatin family/Calx-beta domain
MGRWSRAVLRICVVAGVVAATAVPLSTGAAAAAPTLTVVPAGGINGGDVVEVQVSGFTPSVLFGYSQCILDSTPGADDCVPYSVASTTPAGTATFMLQVARWIYPPSAARWVDCTDPQEHCVVGAAESLNAAIVTDTIHFATPPAPPATRGAITLSPATVPRLGATFTVTGSGFRPNAAIELYQCVAGPTQRSDCVDGAVTATADASGAFSRNYSAGRSMTLRGGATTSCEATSGACAIAAVEAVDFVGTIVAQPIRLDVTVVPGATTRLEGDTGSSIVDVPVKLSAASDLPVTVDWTTAFSSGWDTDVAAQPAVDYESASGTVTFDPGTTERTVPVRAFGDITPEQGELIVVSFHDPTNAELGGLFGLGLVGITDDDTPTIVPDGATITEGDDGSRVLQIPVHLSQPAKQAATVEWATAFSADWDPDAAAVPGVDYEPASGLVTFAPGADQATVSVTVSGDATPEQTELIVVAFSNATSARIGGFYGLGLGAIADDD